MYEMVVNDQVTTFGERAEAVQAAKEFTAQPDRSATANVSDGIETLSFRNGKLIAYSYETRMDRRHRSHANGSADGVSDESAASKDEEVQAKTDNLAETKVETAETKVETAETGSEASDTSE